MRACLHTVCLFLAIALPVSASGNQRATADAGRIIGEITAIDVASGRVSIKDDSGASSIIIIDQQTTLLRISSGEQSLEKAVKLVLSDLSSGDRLYARYRPGAGNHLVDRAVVVLGAEIRKRQIEEREAWQKRSTSGVVVALDPKRKEIAIVSPQRDGVKQITIAASAVKRFRRYAPDSIKFSDARPSSFEEVRVGDQLRALGDKAPDGARLFAEEIISGAFRTVGGSVTSLNPETGELHLKLFGSGQALVLTTGKNSIIRRIPPKLAALIAQRAAQGNSKKADAADSQELIDQLPTIPLSELKPGDVVLTASVLGKEPARLRALTVLAGIDGIIKALQRSGALNGNQLSTGLPPGILDITAGAQ